MQAPSPLNHESAVAASSPILKRKHPQDADILFVDESIIQLSDIRRCVRECVEPCLPCGMCSKVNWIFDYPSAVLRLACGRAITLSSGVRALPISLFGNLCFECRFSRGTCTRTPYWDTEDPVYCTLCDDDYWVLYHPDVLEAYFGRPGSTGVAGFGQFCPDCDDDRAYPACTSCGVVGWKGTYYDEFDCAQTEYTYGRVDLQFERFGNKCLACRGPKLGEAHGFYDSTLDVVSGGLRVPSAVVHSLLVLSTSFADALAALICEYYCTVEQRSLPPWNHGSLMGRRPSTSDRTRIIPNEARPWL